jgi:iron uptake system component EfeO
MPHHRRPLAAVLAIAALAGIGSATGCGSDDGASVREVGPATTSGSGTGAGSGTGSGTGLSLEETRTTTTDDPLVAQAVDEYSAYLAAQVDEMIARARVFTDAVRAGDLAAARAAYAPSRVPWERIEPIAGLIEDIDVAVDARVDDFAGPDDPRFTGWHRLEYLLWEEGTTRGGARFADRLDADLRRLRRELAGLEVPPAALALGAAELIEEVSQGKITGEEDRYSKTDLWDFDANVEGAREVIRTLTPALRQADPALLGRIEEGFADLESTLSRFRRGDGWLPFCPEDDRYPSPVCTRTTLTRADIDLLKAQLAGLSEDLALVPGALGLR